MQVYLCENKRFARRFTVPDKGFIYSLEKANAFLGFSKKAKIAVKVIGDVIVNGIVKVNGIYTYCSPCAAMRGANAARQWLSAQLALHQGRIFRQGFSANLAGAENQPTLAQKMWGERGGSRDFLPKRKNGGGCQRYKSH